MFKLKHLRKKATNNSGLEFTDLPHFQEKPINEAKKMNYKFSKEKYHKVIYSRIRLTNRL